MLGVCWLRWSVRVHLRTVLSDEVRRGCTGVDWGDLRCYIGWAAAIDIVLIWWLIAS